MWQQRHILLQKLSDTSSAKQAILICEKYSLACNAITCCTGSVPTDEAEADAIIDGKDYVKNMAVDFSDVIGPHSDDAKEADKIIDTVSFIPLLPMWPARLPLVLRA